MRGKPAKKSAKKPVKKPAKKAARRPGPSGARASPGTRGSTPRPLLAQGHPVDWWFAFKFNAAAFPGDEGQLPAEGLFGGTRREYPKGFSLQYACASSEAPTLRMGAGYLGTTREDPVGATFDQVYRGSLSYALWNDQFSHPPKEDPMPEKSAPWGHSKGMLAWDDSGSGFVMQVSTPVWPASGSQEHPRVRDGNTLGYIGEDDDILVSQHFWALALTADDVPQVLAALRNASVVTDPSNPALVRSGGPAPIRALVAGLSTDRPPSPAATLVRLSTGVRLLSKPSALHVPPWQLVSARLGGVPLRVASWWDEPKIPTARAGTPGCWAPGLGTPGPVEIATSGAWGSQTLGLEGKAEPDGNHAKVGVSTDPARPLTIFGDMNQQGALAGDCPSSQNGRGGTFYVLDDARLHQSVSALLRGATG